MLTDRELMKINERCFKDWLLEQHKVLTTGRGKTINGEWETELSETGREIGKCFDPESK